MRTALAVALLLFLMAGCSDATEADATDGAVQAMEPAPAATPATLDAPAEARLSKSNHEGGWIQAVSVALPDGTTTTNYSPDGADAFHAPGTTVRIEAVLSWQEPPGAHAWEFCLHGPRFDPAIHCVHGRSSPLTLVLDGPDLGGDYAPEAFASGDGMPVGASVSQDLRWEATVTWPD